MSMIDSEGTVIPSFLATSSAATPYARASSNMFGLMVGRVIASYDPDDEENQSKTFVEYDVVIEARSVGGVFTRKVLPKCKVGNLFGGIADFETWTPRVVEGDTSSETQLGLDSQVLVLCASGMVQEGIIVGGIPHTRLEAKEKKSDGHHWIRQFNGTRMEVNKDGELIFSFQGATAPDGKLAAGVDAGASGSQVKFVKDGSIRLETKDGAQFVHVDHANKKLDIKADKSWTVAVDGPWEVTASGPVKHATRSAYTVNAGALIHHDSPIGTKLGAGTDLAMLGTTYRTAEITKDTAHVAGFAGMAASLASAGIALSTAGASLLATSVLHKVPVAGAVAGSVPLQVAAQAIVAAGGVLTALSAQVVATLQLPITTFEAGAPKYLSLKNSLD